MQSKRIPSLMRGVPSVVQAILLALVSLILLFAFAAIFGKISFMAKNLGEPIAYMLHAILVATGCYLICRQNPKSIWYVPLIANLFVFVSALIEPNFWVTSLYLWYGASFILSIPASIWGSLMGKALKTKK